MHLVTFDSGPTAICWTVLAVLTLIGAARAVLAFSPRLPSRYRAPAPATIARTPPK
jgi:hypothetical protein